MTEAPSNQGLSNSIIINPDNTTGSPGVGVIRYNRNTSKIEISNNGGAFAEIQAGITQDIAGGTNIDVTTGGSTITVATVPNPTFNGKVTMANGHLSVDNSFDGLTSTIKATGTESLVLMNNNGRVVMSGPNIAANQLSAVTGTMVTVPNNMTVTGETTLGGIIRTDNMRVINSSSAETSIAGDTVTTTNLQSAAAALNLLTNMNVSSGVTIDGRDISVDGTSLDVLNGRVNQDLRTTSSPSFANVTVSGNIGVSGLVDGIDISAFKADYDSKVDQDVRSTASPTFASRLQIAQYPNAKDVDIKATQTNGVMRFWSDGVSPFAIDNAGIYVAQIRENSSGAGINIKNNLVCDNGVTVDGVDISTLNGRFEALEASFDTKVNQDVRTSASPSFNNLNISSNITVAGLVDGVDLSAFKADYDSKVNQDVRSTASPSFNSITVSGTVDGVDLSAFKTDYDSKVNQDVRSSAAPSFTGLSVTNTSSTTGEIINTSFLTSNIATGNSTGIRIGRDSSTNNNSVDLLYHYVGSGSTSNYTSLKQRGETLAMMTNYFGSLDVSGKTDYGVLALRYITDASNNYRGYYQRLNSANNFIDFYGLDSATYAASFGFRFQQLWTGSGSYRDVLSVDGPTGVQVHANSFLRTNDIRPVSGQELYTHGSTSTSTATFDYYITNNTSNTTGYQISPVGSASATYIKPSVPGHSAIHQAWISGSPVDVLTFNTSGLTANYFKVGSTGQASAGGLRYSSGLQVHDGSSWQNLSTSFVPKTYGMRLNCYRNTSGVMEFSKGVYSSSGTSIVGSTVSSVTIGYPALTKLAWITCTIQNMPFGTQSILKIKVSGPTSTSCSLNPNWENTDRNWTDVLINNDTVMVLDLFITEVEN